MKALEKHCGEVVPLGPLDSKFIFLGKVINKISTIAFRKKFDPYHSVWVAKELAKALERKLRDLDLDLLIFPGGSEILAFLETDIPKVYFSDTTVNLMVGYYQSWTNLMRISERWGE
jgi:hypothetical protein